MVKFELKKEHVEAVSRLHFVCEADTEYGDRFIPGINRKRPFGDCSATEDMLEIMGCVPGAEGYGKDDVRRAEEVIAELPVALEVITRHRTFKPRWYDVPENGAWFHYVRMKNYAVLADALDEIQKNAGEDGNEDAEILRMFCMGILGDDPYGTVIRGILPAFCRDDAFFRMAAEVFGKHMDSAGNTGGNECGEGGAANENG